MGVYTDWIDGYLLETTYGTSLIANTNTQTNSFGIMSAEAIHPSPKSAIVYGATGTASKEVPAGGAWKGPEDLRGSYTIVMQNGILLYLVMGASTTAASVHTIVPNTTNSTLPSITIQHDLTGTAADWGTQYDGCKVMNLDLHCTYKDQYLWSNVDWVAQTATNIGFVSTNVPVLPPTATTTPYIFGAMTATFNGASFRDNLSEVHLTINPSLKIWRDGSRTIPEPLDGLRMGYLLRILHSPADSTFWDESASTTVTGDVVLKWTKSTNDYIEITMSDCPVTYHEQKTPIQGQDLIEEVFFEPRAISIAVKDAINASYYGE